MEAKELRLGNLVLDRCKPTTLKPSQLVNLIQGIATYEPIPLTEEWFYKFGFSKSNGWFEKNGIELFNIADLYFRANHPIKADVKFVHQLQNLYFALTNEELIISK